jgi:hypothetical protein
MAPMVSSPTAWPSVGLVAARLDRLLGRMAPTTLAELDAVALLNRVDTKFLLTSAQLVELLPKLAQEYRVLEVQGKRLHQYRTLYFDTPEYDLYRLHHVTGVVRHKVRSRAYVDSGLCFFEIKSKTPENRTVKHRLATPELVTAWTPEASAFVQSHLGRKARALQPTLSNDFLRVTLMDRHQTERLTLDLNIQFDCDGRTAVLPGIVIAELKQGDVTQSSAFADAMRSSAISPTSISKYCTGVGLLVSDVEHETAARMLAAIERLTHAQSDEPVPFTLDRTAARV